MQFWEKKVYAYIYVCVCVQSIAHLNIYFIHSNVIPEQTHSILFFFSFILFLGIKMRMF